ncbi:MAG: hypothetical protein J5J06_10465 [Phycisphaerae bacterium]|nr:hypothetical protein [Phycisphaerae bacterium]
MGGLFPLPWLAGCTSISVAPSCPETLSVGDSGDVQANEVNPGAIATYLWEAIPASGGTFADPTAKDTTFTANEEGDIELRLVASDGIYQVVASCQVLVSAPPRVMVALSATPAETPAERAVTLTCTSTGAEPATMFDIEQVSGPTITLIPVSEGVVTLTPLIPGTPEFSCVGTSAGGEMSRPATVTVTVTSAGGGR